jgi:hypothetical protein
MIAGLQDKPGERLITDWKKTGQIYFGSAGLFVHARTVLLPVLANIHPFKWLSMKFISCLLK